MFAGLAAGILSAATGIGSAIANWNSQKNTQQEIWNREDNAVARRAKDLEAAGLSKTLAAGSAATTNVVSAPQTDIGGKVQDTLNAMASVQQIKNAREENANMRESRNVMQSETVKNLAQSYLFNQNAQKAISDINLNAMLANYYGQQIEESKSKIGVNKAQAANLAMSAQNLYFSSLLSAFDYDLARTSGFRSTTGGLGAGLMKLGANSVMKGKSTADNVRNIQDVYDFIHSLEGLQ